MYHSVTFGNKNTWDDWHLIPSPIPVFAIPEVNEKSIEIPGCNGLIDLTEILTGYTTYKNRTGSFTFYVANGYENWPNRFSEISNYLHGQYMRAILEDDPDYYYIGRFAVEEWSPGASHSMITIKYSVAPFKKPVQSTADDWEWDPFDFENDVINSVHDLVVDGSATVVINGGYDRSEMTITSSANMSLSYEGVSYTVQSGTHVLKDLILLPGENTLIFTGNGTITIDYRGGSL